MTKQNTIKLFDGPSLIDGERIIVLLTGLATASSNTKTGDMLQTWIMRYDVRPNEAIKTGQDSSVCGDCPLRPFLFVKSDETPEPCYLVVFQAPLSTWKANKDLPVTAPDVASTLIAGRKVRRGSYGDPAAVPASVWEALPKTKKDTGYTHQWKTAPKAFAGLLMASVHTATERRQARRKGFRTFRVVKSVDRVLKGEILCPASKEAGERTTCARCGLCSGSKAIDNRKDVAIVAH